MSSTGSERTNSFTRPTILTGTRLGQTPCGHSATGRTYRRLTDSKLHGLTRKNFTASRLTLSKTIFARPIQNYQIIRGSHEKKGVKFFYSFFAVVRYHRENCGSSASTGQSDHDNRLVQRARGRYVRRTGPRQPISDIPSLHRSKAGASPTWLTSPNYLSPSKARES